MDVSLILLKLGMCLWITELAALAQSAHHISFTMVVWVTKFHAIRCSKLGSLSQIVVDVELVATVPSNLPCNENKEIQMKLFVIKIKYI